MIQVLALLIAILAVSPAAAQPVTEHLIDIIRAESPRALERHGAEGAAVAMVYNGEVVWAGGFGLAEAGSNRPVDAATVFEIASVTKPVTAWAILKLDEEQLLDLDAPIETYLGGWRLPPSVYDPSLVTARRILAHAAGLSGGGDPGVEPGAPVPDLLQAAEGAGQEGGAITLAHPPGAAYRYSSKGYILLEMALEHVTRERFSDYVGREVLGRLGMEDSSLEWTPALRARAATGHDWYGRPLPHYAHPTRAQGGLIATAADMARFIAASMAGPNGEPRGRGVISPKSVDMTFTPFDYSDDSSLVGLGYNLRTDSGTLVARKTGDHRGFKSIVFAMPEQGTGLVILSNSDRAAAGVFADIACPWSGGLQGDPLRTVCGQLYTLRNAHFALAGALGLGAVALSGLVISGVGNGTRARQPRLSGWRRVRIIALLLTGAFWWAFWYSDIPLRQLGYSRTFFTVRFDPWPTAFIWVSWGVTLLIAVAVLAALFPKVGKTAPAD